MSTDTRPPPVRRKRRISLFLKLTALTTLLVLNTAGVIALFVINAHRDSAEDALRYQGQVLTRMVAHNSEYGVYTEDAESLLSVVGGLSDNPDVAFLEVMNAEHKTLAGRSFRAGDDVPARLAVVPAHARVVSEQMVPSINGEERYVEFVAPVLSGTSDAGLDEGREHAPQAVIGYVRLGLSTERIEASTRDFLQSVLMFTAMLLLGGVVLTVFLAFRITSPLRKLSTLANDISGGQLNRQVQVKGDNELADLADAFNGMLERLRTYQDEIEAANQNLEEKVHDRTGQLQLAMEQAHALASQAQAANSAKNNFLANMSHELRTPLNAVIGLSQLLSDGTFGDVNADQGQCLDDIIFSGRHLLSLVQDVLDVAKIEAGGASIKPELLSPADVVSSSLVMVRDQAGRGGVELAVDFANAPLAFEADERAMNQVITNLLSNAVKFTPSGGRILVKLDQEGAYTLSTRVPAAFAAVSEELATHGSRKFLIISVTDDGIGVEPENLARIFRAFQQEDNSNARRYEGTGLGLTLSQQLVQLHQGVIWAHSEGRGKGARFSFALPLQQKDDRPRTMRCPPSQRFARRPAA